MKNRQEMKESFLSRHFKKKRINCPNCKNSIDAFIDSCPYCGNERNVDILPKKFLNMTFLTDYKELCFFFIGTLGLYIISIFFELGIKNFPINQPRLKDALVYLLSFITVLALFFCVTSHDTRKIIKTFKKQTINVKSWIFVVIGVALIIGFNYGYQAILNVSGVQLVDTENQKLISEIIKKWPAIAFFFVVLLAPITEEFCYRVGLFTFLRKRNRWVGYIVTVIIFAFMHFIPSLFTAPSLMAQQAINIPLYLVPSLILAITYEYAGVTASIYTHIINNLISFVLIFVL